MNYQRQLAAWHKYINEIQVKKKPSNWGGGGGGGVWFFFKFNSANMNKSLNQDLRFKNSIIYPLSHDDIQTIDQYKQFQNYLNHHLEKLCHKKYSLDVVSYLKQLLHWPVTISMSHTYLQLHQSMWAKKHITPRH